MKSDKKQLESVVAYLDKFIEKTEAHVERLGEGVGADLLAEFLEEVREMRHGTQLLAKNVKE